jgi:hypothetical protein
VQAHRPNVHQRFRELAATAIDFSLSPAEEAALNAHLAECVPCRRHAAVLAADATRLRSLERLEAPSGLRQRAVARERRRTTRPVALLAAAALTLALGGAVLSSGGSLPWLSSRPTAIAPAPSGAPVSPAPSPATNSQVPTLPLAMAPELAWSGIGDQPAFHAPFGVMEAVASGKGRLVGVGDGCAVSLSTCHAAVWTSDDHGRTWARVPDGPVFDVGSYTPGRRGEMTDVISTGAGFIGVGRALVGGVRRAAVWTSPDGLTWDRVPDGAGFRFGTMEAIVAGGPGFVAVGSVVEGATARAAVWTSPDGLTWTRAPDDGGRTFDLGGPGTFADGRLHGSMTDVAVTPSDLVAVGSTCAPAPAGGSCSGVAWASHDGIRWERLSASFSGNPYSMATWGTSLIAVGDDGAETGVRAWLSGDGRSWAIAGALPAFQGTLVGVAAAGTRLVAIAASEAHQTAVYESWDGNAWRTVASTASGLDAGVANGLVLDSSTGDVVVVGWDGRTPAAAAWLGH